MNTSLTEDAAPRHGDPGARPAGGPRLPRGLSVAVSREVGARGGSVARRLGRLLGWPVYSGEEIEYLARPGPDRDRLFAEAGPGVAAWADDRLDRLRHDQRLGPDPAVAESARLVLVLAAAGEVVLLGRGAGYLLPAETTLHARVVAPRADRTAYLCQRMRLTPEQAADHLREWEARRADYLAEHVRRHPADLDPFDLVVNTTRLGVEGCAELAARAVRLKLDAWPEPGPELPEPVG